MEAVAFDEGGVDALAAKDLLEGAHDRGRAGAGGAGDRDDRMLGRHGAVLLRSDVACVNRPRVPNSGASILELVVVAVIALDALDLVARAEHEADALVQLLCG